MVRDVMNEFTNEIIGGSDYIALHWRYDKNDWYLHCEKLAKNSTKFRFHPDKDFDKCKGVAEVPIGTLMGRFDAFLTNMTTVSSKIEKNDRVHREILFLGPILAIKHIIHCIPSNSDKSYSSYEASTRRKIQ